jgi:hypothetical protein
MFSTFLASAKGSGPTFTTWQPVMPILPPTPMAPESRYFDASVKNTKESFLGDSKQRMKRIANQRTLEPIL